MATELYEFKPSALHIKAPNAPENIIIKPNNVAFSDVIQEKFQEKGYEPFVNFLKSHSLRYALCDIPTAFYPHHVCEFYYTCTYDEGTDTLTGTINIGTRVSFNSTILRDALRLPIREEYRSIPKDATCRVALDRVNYDPSLEKKRAGTNVVLRQCFPAGYKYLSGVIGKCLGNKVGSLDQLNQYEFRLFYCMVSGREIDYSELIFSQIVDSISAKKRPSYVTFPRFLALVLEFIGTGYEVKKMIKLMFHPCPTNISILFPELLILRSLIKWKNG